MRKKIYSGRIIDLYRYDIKLEGRKVRRDIIVHPGASAVVAFDSDGKIILVKQNRFPHGRVLEIPAGTLEKRETPMQCARRELLEETGYAAGRLLFHIILRLVQAGNYTVRRPCGNLFCFTRIILPSESNATTADAPGWTMISRLTFRPSNFISYLYKSMILPE